ncbi:hypothetical protein ACTXJ5_05680 [Psychrobacter alimentarius]|uniref:hypothetical protein n=1 Tax=Psychrobacter alimentarius TaxID=261164 RepID=UPI003FD6147E
MALTTYHHGITATESSNITPIMKSVSMSTIALVSTSIDADDIKYPLDTPVLLTGITTDDVTKAGAKDTLLSQCLQTIKSIQNTNVVVLRLSEPVDTDVVDTLLSCQSRLGVTPKILIAPEIDTPDMTRKLVEIAKKRRAFVYASPRAITGELLFDKTEIAAYRDTFAARELMLIEGAFGAPGKSQPSDGSGGDSDATSASFLKFTNDTRIDRNDGNIGGLVFSINGGALQAATHDLANKVGSYTMFEFIALAVGDSFSAQGDDDSVDWTDAKMMQGLDASNFYTYGFNTSVLAAEAEFYGFPLPDGVITQETTLTLHPASKLPGANIDYDIFDLIIDPASYTSAELQHFADLRVTPATKNPDGSYTIKSQLTLPPFEPPSGV